MRRLKVFFTILAGAAFLSGCSIFEKVESGDMDAIANALSETDNTELSQTQNGEDYIIDESVLTDVTPTIEAEITSTESGEVSAENGQEELTTQTNNVTYSQGDSANISFRNGNMEAAVIAEITLDSIMRGESAQYIIDMYNVNNPDLAINENTNDNLEFCVVNYTIDLKATEGVPEVSTEVQCSIGGGDLTSNLVYNGITYGSFPTLYNSNSYTVTSGESGNGQIIFMLPVGCANFSITFGDPTIQSATYLFQ